jgi:peptidyl-prolyl cis-trans isomerase A (cyclophilin A)
MNWFFLSLVIENVASTKLTPMRTLAIAVVLAVVASVAASSNPEVEMIIDTCGPIYVQLFPAAAPKTVAFWLNLVRSGWYDSSNHTTPRTVYRYVPNFVIQGGGKNVAESGVPLEYKLPNEKFTLGMARDSCPPPPSTPAQCDSGGSEFFINIANNSATLAPGGSSTHGYAVFGRVVRGFSTLTCLEGLPVSGQFYVNPPVIKSARIIKH